MLITSQRGGGRVTLPKIGGKYSKGAGLLKRGAGTFSIYFCHSLTFLHLEITLSCVIHSKKKKFFLLP